MALDKAIIKKSKVITYIFVIGFFAAIMMLVKWQVFDSERFIAIANERYRQVRIPSIRGSILARDGSTLAFSEPRFDVFVWLPELELAEKNDYQTRDEFIKKVAPIIDEKPKDLRGSLNNGTQWIKIAGKVDVDQRELLLELKQDEIPENYLQGMQFEYVNKRIYPEGDLASHIIGFLGFNTNGVQVGVGGIEQYWEGTLKPLEGFEQGEFDSFGNPITINNEVQLESKPGDTLYTTIDKVLQKKLEIHLKDAQERYDATSVTGIIADPKTGEILALANYPNYDPNEYYKEKDGIVFGNPAVAVPYEIGSIAKVFTIASAIDQKRVTPNTVVLPKGHQGCEVINPDPKPEDNCVDFTSNEDVDCVCTYDKNGYSEPMTSADALIRSDNIGLRHIALTMEYDEFHDYLEKFGVGTVTNIDITGESTGLLKEAKDWNYADQAVFSYGHGFEVTPIQAVSGISSIANDGKRMQPYLISKVVSSDGAEKEFKPRVIEEVVTPRTAQTVMDIMHEVYKNSLIEDRYKSLDRYYISMKSGTALIPYKDRPGYSSEINATYVGFDASPDRSFIMLIKVEEPQVGELSFYNARLVWLDVFNDIKDYIGVKEYSR